MYKDGSKFVGTPVLGVIIDDDSVAIVGSMDNPVIVDFTQPHIVALAVCIEDINCDIGSAHLGDNCSIGSVANVDCSILSGRVSDQRFCALEGVNMVFEYGHNFILIEVGHPMEESIEITRRITVESLANRINGNMITHEFEFVLVVLKGVDHEIFLKSRLQQ
jgi:hypothetical protein